MGKQVDQGTRWESRIVTGAKARGRVASRLAKTGVKNEPDVLIAGNEKRGAVAWERWLRSSGRRRAVRMVTITEDHFYELLGLDRDCTYGYYVQMKSTQAGSLSTWMEGIELWIKERLGQTK